VAGLGRPFGRGSMTNHWNDIDNASCVFVFGANPAENHPACMAHVNAARFGNGKNAKLIVVDPRLTRTARQVDPSRGDMFVRIRPGTNIAFANGLLNWIFNNIVTYNSTTSDRMLAWHNGTADYSTNFVDGSVADPPPLRSTRTFVDDTGLITVRPLKDQLQATYYDAETSTFPLATGYPKYADTRFIVNAAGNDYQRGVLHVPDSTAMTNIGGTLSNFPRIAASVTDTMTITGPTTLQTVWTTLKSHVAAYDTATVAGICGCTESDIVGVAKALIDNSRFASSDWNAKQATPQELTYKATTVLYAMGQTQHTNGSQNIKALAVIQTILGNMGRAGGGINALRGIHNVQGSTDMGLLFDFIPGYSANPAVGDSYNTTLNSMFGYRTIGTGAKDVSTLSNLGIQQRGFANMTQEWFGTGTVPAADISTLYNLWPKGNGVQHITTFRRMVDAAQASATLAVGTGNSAVTYTAVTSGDKGNMITVTHLNGVSSQTLAVIVAGKDITVQLGTDGAGVVTSTAAAVAALVAGTPEAAALVTAVAGGTGLGNAVTIVKTALTGGVDRISSSLVWGQNPAITEPNQGKVRAGLKNLDLLVVVDMFETETAACDRKDTGITYLIPACSHVEEAGSVTNSGRWLQWRERATKPKGNSKADMELLLRLAYALDKAKAFTHITSVAYDAADSAAPTSGIWFSLPTKVNGPAYHNLYGAKYLWTPGDSTAFEDLSVVTERWAPGASAPTAGGETVYGSEVITEAIYKEVCRPLAQDADGVASTTTGGTVWIYSGSSADASTTAGSTRGVGGYNGASAEYNLDAIPACGVAWTVKNRAKSRNNAFTGAATNGAKNYPRWGWAWLYNRRVFYNNGEIAADQSDTFVSPGLVSCLFTINTNTTADWSLVYRGYKKFADQTSVSTGNHYVSSGKTFFGRFPGHTEPYESPREADLVPLWGHNQAGTSRLITSGDAIGTVATYPLVLTSIRCVEHFQGGPITRNNTWNVEAEPVPWIEINAADARTYGIADGDWVNVKTARGNSRASQEAISPNSALPLGAHWAKGFKARVGVGLESNQRVARGVVAIPWHWGDKGLSTGSRANDLCIDAWDANTMIPEYKACLCSIEKM
jgi:anaerobic selenocysteine-containing dehydrogenase